MSILCSLFGVAVIAFTVWFYFDSKKNGFKSENVKFQYGMFIVLLFLGLFCLLMPLLGGSLWGYNYGIYNR